MRVLAVGNRYPPAATGGYERIFAATVAALVEAGHDVRVLTTGGGAESTADVARTLRWYWRPEGFARPSAAARLRLERHNAAVLRRELREWRPDVVSWWGMGGMSLSLIEQVRGAGLPAVGVVGDGWMAYGPEADAWTAAWRRRRTLGAVAERLTGIPTRPDLGAAARWLFISTAVRDRAIAEGHDFPDSGLAHPGVDPSIFPFRPSAEWRWRLACVGRIEPRKGVAVAVRALAELPAEASLVVDGADEGGHRAELEALAARLGVAQRVRFQASPAERVADAYSAADAVLFPVTWAEPWGLVPLEAMSVGRPVIATGTGGSAEYLRQEANALVVEPGDARALAGAVRRLAGDEPLRRRLVNGGRATAERYSQASFEAAVIGALEDVLHGVRT